MRNPTLLVFIALLAFFSSNAQTDQTIDLDHWNGKNNDIPFKISAVKDSRANTETIGIAHHKSKKKDISFRFASSSEAMILKLLQDHFTHGTEADITMQVNKLEIIRVKVGKGTKDKFLFACTFNHTKSGASIYEFNASNTVSPSKNPKLNVTNYISRAITSAVNNFKKDFIKNPDWKVDNGNISTSVASSVQLNKQIIFNRFEPSGDTIALKKGYKLKKSDFAGTVMVGEKDDSYSSLQITYDLKSIDEGNKINVTIFPKAYFLRSASWAKDNDSTSGNWLAFQQLLYDNANLYLLKFKRTLEQKDLSAGYYKTEINKIYNTNAKNFFDNTDQIYEESKFGQDEVVINKWQNKINAELAKFD